MPLLGRDELTLLLDACHPLSSSPTFDKSLVCLWRWVLELFFFVFWDDWPRIVFWLLLLMLRVLFDVDLLWVDFLTRGSRLRLDLVNGVQLASVVLLVRFIDVIRTTRSRV